MKNIIQKSVAGVISQGNGAAAGLQLYATAIGLTDVTRDPLVAEIAAFIVGENDTKRDKSELSLRRKTLRQAKKSAAEFLRLTRDALKPYLGFTYSPQWIEAGFVGAFNVPLDAEKLVVMLAAMKAYLTAHPTQQNAQLNITSERAETLKNDLDDAVNDINEQETVLGTSMATRDTKRRNIQTMIRDLIDELEDKIDPLDERWTAFGFNKPGLKATPAVPTNLVAVLIRPNAVALKWSKAARAEYYRVWKRVMGVDEELVHAGSPADLDFTIEGLPSNSTIKVAVSAVNNGGESAKTEVITIATP